MYLKSEINFTLYEDDIGPMVSGGGIPANEDGTSSPGAVEARVISDVVRKAARAARVILAVKDKLGEDGVNSRFMVDVLEGLSVDI